MSGLELLMYIMLGAIIGMIYSIRRILILERRILEVDRKITLMLKKKK